MFEQLENPKENKRRAVANSSVQKKSKVKQGVGVVGNRQEALQQRTLHPMVNNSPRAMQKSKFSYPMQCMIGNEFQSLNDKFGIPAVQAALKQLNKNWHEAEEDEVKTIIFSGQHDDEREEKFFEKDLSKNDEEILKYRVREIIEKGLWRSTNVIRQMNYKFLYRPMIQDELERQDFFIWTVPHNLRQAKKDSQSSLPKQDKEKFGYEHETGHFNMTNMGKDVQQEAKSRKHEAIMVNSGIGLTLTMDGSGQCEFVSMPFTLDEWSTGTPPGSLSSHQKAINTIASSGFGEKYGWKVTKYGEYLIKNGLDFLTKPASFNKPQQVTGSVKLTESMQDKLINTGQFSGTRAKNEENYVIKTALDMILHKTDGSAVNRLKENSPIFDRSLQQLILPKVGIPRKLGKWEFTTSSSSFASPLNTPVGTFVLIEQRHNSSNVTTVNNMNLLEKYWRK